MSREFELKFEIDPATLSQLKAHPSFRTALDGGARPKKLVSIYFDDAKGSLREAGLSLRVRRVGRRYVQTIKANPVGAIIDRSEWETNVDGPNPDLSAAEGTPLEALLEKKSVRNGLAPLFSTKVERLSTTVQKDSSVVELSADVGAIEAGPNSAPLCELEVELKTGEPSFVFEVARSLNETLPLRLGVLSKSERGYALLKAEPRRPAKAEQPALERTMTAAAGFQAIARTCIRQLALNESMLRETRDPNALHQMRVATRRLRAAISLFKRILVDDKRDAINSELRWIARLLGEARDLDVFLARLSDEDEQSQPAEDRREFVAHYERQRGSAYDRVLEALDSQRFRTLVLDAVAWIESGPWLANDDRKAAARRTEPVKLYVAGVLRRRRKAIVKEGASLEEIDDEARHDVRIRAKKLRYASEFVASLYGPKATRRHAAFVSALENLQACLGELNDIAKAHELGSELGPADGSSGGQAPSPVLAGDLASRSKALLKDASRAYAEFVDAKPFWR